MKERRGKGVKNRDKNRGHFLHEGKGRTTKHMQLGEKGWTNKRQEKKNKTKNLLEEMRSDATGVNHS